MTPTKYAYKVLVHTQSKGLKTVIASNPMLPINVQLMRLKWAGVRDLFFDLITSVENSTFCKPRLEYYSEICKKIDVLPKNCLMVGNDRFNDMIASKIGMKTFLTNDAEHLSIELSREFTKDTKLEMPTPDFKGCLKELIKVIDNDS